MRTIRIVIYTVYLQYDIQDSLTKLSMLEMVKLIKSFFLPENISFMFIKGLTLIPVLIVVFFQTSISWCLYFLFYLDVSSIFVIAHIVILKWYRYSYWLYFFICNSQISVHEVCEEGPQASFLESVITINQRIQLKADEGLHVLTWINLISVRRP